MSNEVVLMSILGAIGASSLGLLASVIKDWINSINKNTVQVTLLNEKFENFIQELDDLKEDVDNLKIWQAKTDPDYWK